MPSDAKVAETASDGLRTERFRIGFFPNLEVEKSCIMVG